MKYIKISIFTILLFIFVFYICHIFIDRFDERVDKEISSDINTRLLKECLYGAENSIFSENVLSGTPDKSNKIYTIDPKVKSILDEKLRKKLDDCNDRYSD